MLISRSRTTGCPILSSFIGKGGVRTATRLVAAAALALTSLQVHPQDLAALRAGFLNPPPEARPMVRWWWFGPAVEKPEILHELQQMKADGIGGAELAFVYPESVNNNLDFLSTPMLEAVTYAQAEGRKLGLRIDVTLCSGWPYGGPATTLKEAATRLRIAEVPIAPNATSLTPPKLNEGETLLYAALVEGTPMPPPARRSAMPGQTWDPATAQPLTAITPFGTPRVALYFIQSHTRQQVKRAAAGAEGYVLDPFSHDAVATHLKAVGEPLVKAFGSTPPYAIFSDSLEAYGADWTPLLPQEFRKRRGYDLIPHLPELAAPGPATPATQKVRHDYGQTLTELVNENYLTQINTWAKAHGTRFRSQTYGEPAVSFSSQALVDLPEGEGPQWRAFSTLRWATSANHVFGNNVTSGETYTWLHSPVFRATPLDMKAEADIDFIMGENQLIFHGWPYSPSAEKLTPGDPGWSLYAAAALNDHNPWHPVMPAVTQYITRLSWLLRQGQPANQVAILLPTDDAWASFSPGKVTVTGAMSKLVSPELMSAILSAGYNVDYIDAEAIEKVGLGTHQILVIPPTDRIPAATLRKIAEFKQHGGKVISVGRQPSTFPDGKPLPETKVALATNVDTPALLGAALNVELPPDLQILCNVPGTCHPSSTQQGVVLPAPPNDRLPSQLGFIHRRLPNSDLFFIVNTGNTPLSLLAAASTRFDRGQVVNPETGAAEGFLNPRLLQLNLAPYQSLTVLFSAGGPAFPGGVPGGFHGLTLDLSHDWTVNFPTLQKTVSEPTLTDWTADSATLHFSGEAIYTRDFDLTPTPTAPLYLQVTGGHPEPGAPNSPAEHAPVGPDGQPNPLVTRTGPGMHAYYDPPIHEGALVFINGQPAGALWHPPYKLDVTKLLKPGVNHIEIRVYNTALNAWSAIPPRDYAPLKARYGDRFQMQDLDRVKPIPSGILGTIQLIQEPAQ